MSVSNSLLLSQKPMRETNNHARSQIKTRLAPRKSPFDMDTTHSAEDGPISRRNSRRCVELFAAGICSRIFTGIRKGSFKIMWLTAQTVSSPIHTAWDTSRSWISQVRKS